MDTNNPYLQAGVDTEKGDQLVEWLQERTPIKSRLGEVVDGIGGFAGMFRFDFKRYKDPILVASTDGVGTKLLLGIEYDQMDGLGVDLVAMCVNDLYCVGARPMFFIDYYAAGVLNDRHFKSILNGINIGLRQCETPLLGGETAELPGLYAKGHFDLAGFVVGVVDRDKQVGAHKVLAGDLIYALPSSGFHSNGFSLIRKWLGSQKTVSPDLVKSLLTPTKIYSEVPDLIDELTLSIHAVANITGGGISGNLPRVLPGHLQARIHTSALPKKEWMQSFILQHAKDMMSVEPVFNLGCGMIVVIGSDAAESFEHACSRRGLEAARIGEMIEQVSEGVIFV